jgi:hypothetical protein
MNPAREVKTERFSRTKGKTPAFVEGEVQRLLGAIETSTHTGLRDRAVLGSSPTLSPGSAPWLTSGSKTIILPESGFCSALRRKEAKRKTPRPPQVGKR